MPSSVWQSAVAGGAQGAGTGLLVGGPWGAAVGGVLGAGFGAFKGRSSDKANKRAIKYQKATAQARIAAAQSQLADYDEASTYQRQGVIGRGLGDSSIMRGYHAKNARRRALYETNVNLAHQGYQLAREGRLAEQKLGYINLLDNALTGLGTGVTGYALGWNPSTMAYRDRGAGQFSFNSSDINPMH